MLYWVQVLKKSKSLPTLIILSVLITILGLLSPIFIIHIFNRYIAFGLQGTLLFLVSGALIVATFELIFRNQRNKIFNKIIMKPSKDLKLELLGHLFRNNSKNENQNFNELIDLKNNFFHFLSPKNQSSLFDSLFAILIIFILFFLEVFLASIFLIMLLFFIFLQNRLIIKKQRSYPQSLNKEYNSLSQDFTKNKELLKFYNSYNYSGFKLEKFFSAKIIFDSFISEIDGKQNSFTSYFILLSSIIVIGLGSIIVVEGNLSVGSLIGFNIFATRALGVISSTQNSVFILKKTDEYILTCRNFFKETTNRADGLQLSKCNGVIELKNIDFSHHNENKFLLRNLSLLFKPSEITSVSGKNGSGKTTLVKLIIGFLKPRSGEILIDQTNLDKLSLVWFREQVSYVSQRIEILGSSVMDNILISNTRLNELEISRLLQTVGLDNELKKSNLTLSGELNDNISNGILKKIQIARSIARNSKIYLFDDPLLYLDVEGKKMVIKLLSSLKRSGKTVVCFSNDEDIINLCDKKITIGKDNDK